MDREILKAVGTVRTPLWLRLLGFDPFRRRWTRSIFGITYRSWLYCRISDEDLLSEMLKKEVQHEINREIINIITTIDISRET